MSVGSLVLAWLIARYGTSAGVHDYVVLSRRVDRSGTAATKLGYVSEAKLAFHRGSVVTIRRVVVSAWLVQLTGRAAEVGHASLGDRLGAAAGTDVAH